MSIRIKEPENKKLIRFLDLKCGDVFIYNGDYCLALDNDTYAYYNISRNFTDFNPTGRLMQRDHPFNGEEEVEVVNATLTITRE